MSKGLLFWILMILWLLFSIWGNWPAMRGGNYGFLGGSLLLFVLLAILGWAAFGPPVK